MEPGTRGDWPNIPWDLTAPESQVLFEGPERTGATPFKMAVLELIARGHLAVRTEETKGLFGRRGVRTRLTQGPNQGMPDERPLRAVSDLWVRSAAKGRRADGVPVEDFAKAAAAHYQKIENYAVREVFPALEARGYLVIEETRRWGLFKRRRASLTPAGVAASGDLKARIAIGEQHIPIWLKEERERALTFAGYSGAAVLLMAGVYPELEALTRRPVVADGTVDGGTIPGDASGATAGLDESAGALGTLDALPHFDFNFDLDFGVLDSLAETFQAIDSAIDSGLGSFGGDTGHPSDGGGGGGSD